ncbi:MAG TPA: ComF family protein [Candidatus Eisenbacteria bacterium]|jgi:ComF family protein|nr:ComF family protein [Candidatus Eisenbacteria bacterium]
MWKAWGRDLADAILDRRCPGCADRAPRDREVCDACDAQVERTGIALCLACLRGDDPGPEPSARGCPRHGSTRLVLAGPPYDPTLERILRAFKYEGATRLASWIAELVPEPPARGLPAWREMILVPVPLHPAKRAARGFDQALLLAEIVSKRWGIPVVRALERIREHPAQATLDAVRRRVNVRGAFRCVDPRAVEGRPVLLLDDVVTTGSTMLEAGAPLEGAQAAWILGLSAARGGDPEAPEPKAAGAVAGKTALW